MFYMFVNIKELSTEESFACIYKLNYPNGKIYIGQTVDIKRRMYEHNNPNKATTPCDFAIIKYGKIEEVEILERVEDVTELDAKEQFYIAKYKSNCRDIGYNLTIGGGQKQLQGENSQRAKLTNDEVLGIRKRRANGEDKHEVYKDFNAMSLSGFEKVWKGETYRGVGEEYLKVSPQPTREEQISLRTRGERSPKAKLTESDVIAIRERHATGESQKSIQKDYPHVNRNTISRICTRQTWRHIA